MSWYKVTISAHQRDSLKHATLQDNFFKIFKQPSAPKDMAMFSTGWSSSNTMNFYFTPACAAHPLMKDLIDSCGALPCEEPTREIESELCLFVGDSVRWGDHIWSSELS